MKISIKVKLSVFLAILLLAALGILSVLILQGIKNNQKQQDEEYLMQQGAVASSYIKQAYLMDSVQDPKGFLVSRSQELAKQLELISGMHVILYDVSGNVLSDSRPAAGKTDVSSLLHYALKDKNAYLEEGNDMIFLSPLHHSNNQIGVIQFNYSIEKNMRFYKDIERLFLSAGMFAFIVCLIGAYLYVHPLAQGILTLKNSVREIADGDYTGTVRLQRNDELGELSEGVYLMSRTIEKNLEDIKREKDNLSLAVNKLESVGKQQKQFIGNVTHEFKNPLTVIKAYTDLIGMYPDDGNLLTEARENIEREAQRLSAMVEKVLELSSLEKYNFELHMTAVDIYDVLTEVCEHAKGKIQKFGLHLHAGLIHQSVTADEESLNQIFVNLIDNAIKYNRPNGEIWVTSGAQEDRVWIVIRNTGIDIPPDEREKVFEPFYRVDQTRSSESGGTGLGLALVKDLIELQGASISVLDIQSEGTAFEIRFPIR